MSSDEKTTFKPGFRVRDLGFGVFNPQPDQIHQTLTLKPRTLFFKPRTPNPALWAALCLLFVQSCAPAPPPPPPSPPPAGMILISAGAFTMGQNGGPSEEFPAHQVKLSAFYLDQKEVTNQDFSAFVQATGYQAEGRWKRYALLGREDHPVVSVTWNDAQAFAKWAGKRLPTEAEWEYAARANRPDAMYGASQTGPAITPEQANFGHFDTTADKNDPLEGIQTMPVGAFEPNPFGLYQMAGNAAEWCADWYDPHYFATSSPKNPPGPPFGRGRVVRGGSWNDRAEYLQVTHRYGLPPGSIAFVLGFRCAKDLPQPPKPKSW